MMQPRKPPPGPFDRPDPNSIPTATWRDEVVGASGGNVAAGIWLALSPFLLGYGYGEDGWNELFAGMLIALIAVVRVTSDARQAWLSWINLGIGAWVFAHGALFASSTVASVNEIVTATLVVLLAVLSAAATDAARRRTRRRV